MPAAASPLPVVLAGVLGVAAGLLVHRLAAAFPWRVSDRPVAPVPTGAGRADGDAVQADAVLVAGPPVLGRAPGRTVLAVLTAALWALAAARFGLSPQLPAWLLLAAVGVLLTAVDLRYHLLPDRVVLPALAAGALLLGVAAAVDGAWGALLRAGLGAVALFAVFLVLALIAPAGLGMGDVKLAALLGLHLGWLGWGVLVTGAAAGFVVQAAVALVLLAARRVGLRSELPFGPAMLAGAALAVACGPLVATV